MILNNEGVVAFPTETVYGLGARADSKKAIEKIFQKKNRPSSNPLIVHVESLEACKPLISPSVDAEILTRFKLLAKQFWPGPLTIILPHSPKISALISAGTGKVALRIPKSPAALCLLKASGKPLVAPSANLSERPSPTCSAHVATTLVGQIDAILDGGPCPLGIESTVIDISEKIPVILRPGAISLAAIQKVLPNTAYLKKDGNSPTCSPGQSARHYAPLGKKLDMRKASDLKTLWHTATPLVLRASTSEKLVELLGQRPKGVYTFTMPNSAASYAQRLYETLYKIETIDSVQIVFEAPPKSEPWKAIVDRLTRACTS